MRFCLILVSLSVLSFLSCDSDKSNCRLTGKITDCPNGTILYIDNFENGLLIDSVVVKDSVFQTDIPITIPTRVIIHNQRNQYQFRDRKEIWLEPSEIEVTGSYEFLENASVTGSDTHVDFVVYKELYKSNEQSMSQIFRMKYDILKMKRGHSDKAEFEFDSMCNSILELYREYITSCSESYIALTALSDINNIFGRHRQREIEELFSHLPEHLKSTDEGLTIARTIALQEIPRPGDRYIDIIQSNQLGDTIKLSSFEGKYILVDFWASWCAPCRSANQRHRKIYSVYEENGLVMYGVSGDYKRDNWEAAIANDSLPWSNVSDLNGWNNSAFEAYEIKRIPSQVLVDPKGIIIGRDFCSSELNVALDSIFSLKTVI